MKVERINPANMFKPRGYSHAISVAGPHKTIYIGGQNAIDEHGALVGKGNLQLQTLQVLNNIEKVLQVADATLGNVVRFGIHIVQGRNPQEGFQAFRDKWGDTETVPTITVVFVAGLGNPDWLVEIDAIAVVPE